MRRIALLLLLAAAAACQSRDNAAGTGGTLSGEPSVADTVAAAQAQYNAAVFDTIRWPSDSARVERGATVFNLACAECHGPKGRGDGHKVNEKGDTLRPPDFAAPGWRLAGDTAEVRKKIYTGNVLGMPHWGLRHIEPRDIDAVAAYILTVLHPAQ